MTRRLAGRYWASLTGRDTAVRPLARGRDGYSFGRRYFAALLGISLPLHPPPGLAERRVAVAQRARPRHTWSLATGLALGALATVFVFATVITESPHGAGNGATEVPFTFAHGDTNTVPRCEDFSGSGTIPDTGAAVLLVSRSGDTDLYYGATLEFDGDMWEAHQVVVGTEADADREFTLDIVAVTPEVADELASQPDKPVQSVDDVLASKTVVRDDDFGGC